MVNEELLQELRKKICALEDAVLYGIISLEDAEKQISMNIENYIQKEFDKYNIELKCAYTEANNTWRIRVPKRVQTVLSLKSQYYGSTKKIVLKKLYDDLNGKRQKNITLLELFDEWYNIERVNDIDVEESTRTKDLQYRKWIEEKTNLANCPVKTISTAELNKEFKNMTKGRTLSATSFGNFKTVLNLMFDYAVEQEIVEHNISRELKTSAYKFKVQSNSINDVFTSEEIAKLWRYMIEKNTVYSLACALAFCLGCRIGEIKALRWENINFERRYITINAEVVTDGKYANQQKLKEHTKSGLTEGNRDISFFDDAYITLQRIKEKGCDEEFLFLGKTGKFLLTQECNKNIKEACEALGIKYMSSHKIRKWAATEALRNGMDEVSLMYTFGWKNRQTADHYIKTARTSQAQQQVMSKVYSKTL